jgi:hypothetical protein
MVRWSNFNLKDLDNIIKNQIIPCHPNCPGRFWDQNFVLNSSCLLLSVQHHRYEHQNICYPTSSNSALNIINFLQSVWPIACHFPLSLERICGRAGLCQKHGRGMMQRLPRCGRCAVVVPTYSRKVKHDLVEPWGLEVQGESTGYFLQVWARFSAWGLGWRLPVLRPTTSLSCRPSDSRNGRTFAKERHMFARPIASSRFAVGGRPDRAFIHQWPRGRTIDDALWRATTAREPETVDWIVSRTHAAGTSRHIQCFFPREWDESRHEATNTWRDRGSVHGPSASSPPGHREPVLGRPSNHMPSHADATHF